MALARMWHLYQAHFPHIRQEEKAIQPHAKNENLLEVLVTPTKQFDNMPNSLLPKKKRKDRKQNLSITK